MLVFTCFGLTNVAYLDGKQPLIILLIWRSTLDQNFKKKINVDFQIYFRFFIGYTRISVMKASILFEYLQCFIFFFSYRRKKFDLFYKNYTWRKFFVTLWRELSLTAVKSAMILKLTIVDLNNCYVFKTTFAYKVWRYCHYQWCFSLEKF